MLSNPQFRKITWSLRLLITLTFLFLRHAESLAQDSELIDIEQYAEISLSNITQIQLLHQISLTGINQVSWSTDEQSLALATDDGIWIYDVSDGAITQLQERGTVYDVEFIDSQDTLIGKFDEGTSIYQHSSLEYNDQLPFSFDAVNTVGNNIAVGGIESVDVYDLSDFDLIQKIPVIQYATCEYACPVQDVAFSL